MCGILLTIPKTNHEQFKTCLDTLKHRGPDDWGIESIGNDITLGHRRLAIVDLAKDAHQPMSDINKRYSIVFNGEIYNFLEIKLELKSKGYNFVSHCDTEVLLSSFVEWGDECVLKFNGMWAFAIWDNYKKELFLSRDRFGKKPLFYAFLDSKIIFASEMKAIFPFLSNISISKNFYWMKNDIFDYENTQECLVDKIKRFPLGHSGVLKNGKLTIKRYWNTLEHLRAVPQNYEQQVEYFRELFFDACRIRMRSDVPIGTALSGGLDSSATISAMAHLKKVDYGKNDWQHAFVATFKDTPLDESRYAKMVTDNIGINATYIDIDPLKYWDKLNEYLYMFEEIYITSPIPMIATYKSVKEHGISVTLDGHGADELFSGYGHLLEALWDCKFSYKNIINILNTYHDTIGDSAQFNRQNGLKIYIKYMIKKIIKKLLHKDIKSKDLSNKNFQKLDNFSQHLYIIFHESILPTLLRNYDRYSMINGVEIRMPFMDHRIVTFVNSLSYSSKFGYGYTKRLIRDAMEPYMPEQITWRKTKIGFNTPIVNWMQNDLKEWFLDTIHNQNFLDSNVVDNPHKLQKDIIQIVNKKNNLYSDAEQTWARLSPYLWEQAVIKRKYG